VYVSFDAKKTFGKTTTIAELLKEKSSLVPELAAGQKYRSDFDYPEQI
jgi:PGF-pre-PGF domain-containing protein